MKQPSKFDCWFLAQFGPTPNQTNLGREMELAERKADIARLKWRAARDQWIRRDAALKAWNAATGVGDGE